jgi:hypothetical protein
MPSQYLVAWSALAGEFRTWIEEPLHHSGAIISTSKAPLASFQPQINGTLVSLRYSLASKC